LGIVKKLENSRLEIGHKYSPWKSCKFSNTLLWR